MCVLKQISGCGTPRRTGDNSDDDSDLETARLFDSTEDEDEDEQAVGLQWKSNNKFPSLNDDERARLPAKLQEALQANSCRWIGSKPGFYKFVHYVVKRFRSRMTKYVNRNRVFHFLKSGVLHPTNRLFHFSQIVCFACHKSTVSFFSNRVFCMP